MLQALPEWSIEKAIVDYNGRTAPAKPKAKIVYLLSRDALLRDKVIAVRHFLAFCRETFGDPIAPQHLEALKRCRMPYGWFAAYRQDTAKLRTALPRVN